VDDQLAGKHLSATGAGGGIGLVFALACLEQGAHCTLVDLATQPSTEVLNWIDSDAFHYLSTDITQTAQIEAMLDMAERRFGSVQVPFNNAAVFDMAPLLDSHEAMGDRLFAVNVKGMSL
jgi:D-sorbitol dehydrogenase (acceptor)